MIKFDIEKMIEITGGRSLKRSSDEMISGFSIDSRTIKAGDIFLAVKGENFDGHSFLEDALDRGASGIIISQDVPDNIKEKARDIIFVGDVLKAIADISREIRKSIGAKVIAVTGSNGKTTVKDYLANIVSSEYNVLVSKRSFNNLIGVGLTLFEAQNSHDIVILELGTNHPGEMGVLGEIANPDIALITNVGRSHMEFFHDTEGVFKEKTSLLDHLAPGGQAFINGDDILLRKIKGKRTDIKSYGMGKNNDIVISNISKGKRGYRFFVGEDDYMFSGEGLHNVQNAAAAISVAGYLGIKKNNIREKIKDAPLPPMRLERIEAGDLIFINDAYNANPDSFERALDVLEDASCEGDRVIIAGDMFELGERSAEFHRELGKSIAGRKIKFLIATGKWAHETIKGAADAGMPIENTLRSEDHKTISGFIRLKAAKRSTILLKASRKAKLEEILRCFTTCSIN
ncbi:MAG: UDP-N-acetylmuramoyl-tripeptide--D-alanyl-D-alanine ligase [Candidatus Omnitrophota bacterium]